jgi:hypothetical protein
VPIRSWPVPCILGHIPTMESRVKVNRLDFRCGHVPVVKYYLVVHGWGRTRETSTGVLEDKIWP